MTSVFDLIAYATLLTLCSGSTTLDCNGESLASALIRPLGRQCITTFANSKSGVSGRAAGAEQLLDSLVVIERKRQHRMDSPSLVAIDSQTVKIVQFIEEETGIDGNKKINGRKGSIAVDRLGLPWSLAVTSANTSDNEAGKLVVDRLGGKVPRLKTIAADHGYKVSFIEHVEGQHDWKVEIAPQRRTTKTRK